MESLGISCPNCGYVFRGQRTGKCPNCEQSAYTRTEGFYTISPEQIRRFRDFDRHGGDIMAPGTLSRNVRPVEISEEKSWVTLSVLGAIVTFKKTAEGPKIIYSQINEDGFGVDDFPEKIMAEATLIATDAMNE